MTKDPKGARLTAPAPPEFAGASVSDAAQEASILKRCEEKGLRMTGQRRVIGQVLGEATDHPDVEELYRRAAAIDENISIATVYRTVKLFEEAGILERHEFLDGRARYEDAERAHHDHLIDLTTGKVIEFVDPDIERLQKKIAERLGYRLVAHRLELYAAPLEADEAPDPRSPKIRG